MSSVVQDIALAFCMATAVCHSAEAPWMALSVGRFVYSSRPTDDGYRFVYSALWRGDGRLARAEWKNRGRMPGSCVVKVDGERVGGELGDGTRITVGSLASLTGAIVPDFALGAYLASRPLAAGDSVRLTVLRCDPHRGPEAIQFTAASGVVRDTTDAAAAGAAPVPALVVLGASDYAFRAVIARRDGVLLRTVTPQGSVGWSGDRLVRR